MNKRAVLMVTEINTVRSIHWPTIIVIAFASGCAHRSGKPYDGPLGKVTSVSEGGAYIGQERGTFSVGDEIVISQNKCKEVGSGTGRTKTCNNYEYGTGRVERRGEDGRIFIRTDAISIPIGTQIRLDDGRPNSP